MRVLNRAADVVTSLDMGSKLCCAVPFAAAWLAAVSIAAVPFVGVWIAGVSIAGLIVLSSSAAGDDSPPFDVLV